MTTELPAELQPVANHVLFQFVDEIDKNNRSAFKEKTSWGFQVPSSHTDSSKNARWVTIIGLGPDASDDFHIGQMVLVDALKWTRVVEYNGVEFARTDDKNIIAVDDET